MLPEPNWLPMDEAPARIAQLAGVSEDEAKTWLRGFLRDARGGARARGYTGGVRPFRGYRASGPDRDRSSIPPEVWERHEPDWAHSRIGPYDDVLLYWRYVPDILRASRRARERSAVGRDPDPPSAPTAAPAGGDVVSAPGGSVPAERRTAVPRSRRADPDAERSMASRIRQVIAAAEKKWPDPAKRPSLADMARKLTDVSGRRYADFREGTVRQILGNRYPPQMRLKAKGEDRLTW